MNFTELGAGSVLTDCPHPSWTSPPPGISHNYLFTNQSEPKGSKILPSTLSGVTPMKTITISPVCSSYRSSAKGWGCWKPLKLVFVWKIIAHWAMPCILDTKGPVKKDETSSRSRKERLACLFRRPVLCKIYSLEIVHYPISEFFQ